MELVITQEGVEARTLTDHLQIWDELTTLLVYEDSDIDVTYMQVSITVGTSSGNLYNILGMLTGDGPEMSGFVSLVRHYIEERRRRSWEDRIILIVRAVELTLGKERYTLQDYDWEEIGSEFLDHFDLLD